MVSVIVPAYNQAHFLGDAIQSALDQTLDDLEVIVVDDGSTDRTPEVARDFADPRVRYLFQQNRGLSAARNAGIRHARGAFLSFLDSDDVFLPRKLEKLVIALERRPEAGLAAGQAIPIDEDGNRRGRVFDQPLPEKAPELALGNPLHVGSVLIRKSWQERVGFFDETLRSYEDWDLWLRLALAGCNWVWVNEPVALYRFHAEQMTRISLQMTTATFAVLDKLFSSQDLPEEWRLLQDRAFSRAHLRGAAQATLAGMCEEARRHFLQALLLDPTLQREAAVSLAARFRAWAELPKVSEPLEFLEAVYANLPAELESLAAEKNRHLGRAALDFAFEENQRKNLNKARRYAWKALQYQPSLCLNRGVVSILKQSLFQERKGIGS